MRTIDELGVSPAPWRMSPTVGDVENTVTENFETHDNTICTCWGTMQEVAADARLIAAAPELYDALREAVIEFCHDCEDQKIEHCREKCFVAKWRDAIANAGGESEKGEAK